MTEAILFDFGQTLVDSAEGFRTAERDAQRKLFAQLSDLAWDEFIDLYRRKRKALHDQSQISRVDLWRIVCEGFDRTPDMESLVRWEREYWQTVNQQTVPFPEAVQVLDRLRGEYRLALISNTQGQVEGEGHRLKEFPELMRFFEVIIVSGENGINAKPDPQPFRLCLEKLVIKAQDAVYVGDDYRIDVCGASGVGIQPVWLKHHTVKRNWPAVDDTVPVIMSLDPLLSLATILPSPDCLVTPPEKRA
ncbi:MAG: HAD family hydrolase [Acidiferrobacterales bacterium]